MSQIITRHVHPPIPDPRWEWCAYHSEDEEQGYHYGWGSTEQEAVEDLQRLDQERAECEEDDQQQYEYETGYGHD